ncbi:cysteine hydrolase family protein [Ornithinimicrobium sediminis]|uniref:cysteine hydrolase family protein n=1 Tax=Ornithinimicrobium sediminis TaxID=2904603 RepID=UPI001E3E51A1|nr:cysteine hydrolase family protein [Ornithinimicrobium sediminis]MCE0485518.1 cysteine hydrolase [Ornithinimicrobium sediminis]
MSDASGGAGSAALVVVDVQTGFGAVDHWGRRDNPAAEANIGRLLRHWRAHGLPVVVVRHDSGDPVSPLHPSSPGNALQPVVGQGWDLLVTKSVNSSFHGSPDLDAWLRGQGISSIVVCGITTNHCCETTARVGGNLGYEVRFVLDATYTFDRVAPDGDVVPAATLARVTATNLHGEFATVVSTADLLAGEAVG